MAGKNYKQVARISAHFNIFRNIHDAHTGDVTVAEQIKAITRFVRWHQRQVEVGTALLTSLHQQQAAESAQAPAEAAEPSNV